MSADRIVEHPLHQAQALIAQARRDFAADVDALLQELIVFSNHLGAAVGEVSREEALLGLRRFVLEKFDQRLPMQSTADPVLVQLVREAHEFMTDYRQYRDTRINARDWMREAERAIPGLTSDKTPPAISVDTEPRD